MSRSLIIIGNWKMHKTLQEAEQFVRDFLKKVPSCQIEVGLAVPFTALAALSRLTKSFLKIGAQDISQHNEGAYTGEISGAMLRDAGASFTLVGHSERRRYHQEGAKVIAHKVRAALSQGLRVVLCVGETEQEHFLGETEKVLEEQLLQGLKEIKEEEVSSLVIAYEPVWAIGTGRAATPEEAQQAHSFCRSVIEKKYGKGAAMRLSILYGGSVSGKNIQELLKKPDIDGALVGGASLDVESFVTIVNLSGEINL